MTLYSLLGRNGSTGTFDTSTGIAECRGKKRLFNSGMVIEPGDTLVIKGEEFVVSNFRAVDFGSTVKRRTQIIQPWDASYAIFSMGLHGGMKVLESGGGSGAMSMYILQTLGDSGKLVTLENNGETARSLLTLRDSLKLQGKWDIVNISIEDYAGQFSFDAGMLDLPEPWKAAGNLRKIMAPGSVLCTYLPTYNQVEKTVAIFSGNGFYNTGTDEIIRRRILVRNGATRPDNDIIGHTAFISSFIRTSGIRS